jgi:hypothetical protein
MILRPLCAWQRWISAKPPKVSRTARLSALAPSTMNKRATSGCSPRSIRSPRSNRLEPPKNGQADPDTKTSLRADPSNDRSPSQTVVRSTFKYRPTCSTESAGPASAVMRTHSFIDDVVGCALAGGRPMKRCDFITLLGGATAWPAARRPPAPIHRCASEDAVGAVDRH